MAHLEFEQQQYSGDEYEEQVAQPLSLQEQKEELKRKLMELQLKGKKKPQREL